jgi:hypothetical protein
MPHACPAAPDLVVAELQRRTCLRQKLPKPLLPLLDRLRTDSLAVEMQQVEQEKDECLAVPGVRCILDQAEGGRAVRPDAAQFPVEIGLLGRERRYRRRYGRVFMRPVKPGARQQPNGAAVQPCMHAVAIELDFMEPFRPVRRLVDQLGELRLHPGGQRHRLPAPPFIKRSHRQIRAAYAKRRSAVRVAVPYGQGR